ncbi:hypothetical protein JXA80_12845 [bacterium]|nr:hypothetical protein [candidate division CSSED10-310 bacterium]
MRHETIFIVIAFFSLALAGVWVRQPADCTTPHWTDEARDTPTALPPTWTPTPLPPCLHTGDVDDSGSLTAADSQQCFFFVLSLLEPTYQEACAADCNNSGTITAADSQTIFEAVLSLDSCAEPLP